MVIGAYRCCYTAGIERSGGSVAKCIGDRVPVSPELSSAAETALSIWFGRAIFRPVGFGLWVRM